MNPFAFAIQTLTDRYKIEVSMINDESELNVGNGYAVRVLESESLEPKQIRVSRGSDVRVQ